MHAHDAVRHHQAVSISWGETCLHKTPLLANILACGGSPWGFSQLPAVPDYSKAAAPTPSVVPYPSCCLCAVSAFRDSPDFTKTSQDGYTFDTYWEGRMIAKDIVNKHTETKQPHMRKHRHHDHMDAEEVMASFHAT